MDFWGINRARSSLRLQSLKRLLAVGQQDDISRFAGALPEIVSGRPLTPKEAEVLLAFIGGVKTRSSCFYESLLPNLSAILLSSSDIWVDETELVAPSAVEGCALRYGKCLARQINIDLGFFFAKRQEISVIPKFVAAFSEKWRHHETLNNSQFVALFGSLLGLLEGLVLANVPSVIDQTAIEYFFTLCSPEFLVPAQNHLSQLQEVYELSIPALLKNIAEVVLLYAPASGAQLNSLTSFSESQLEMLEESHQFQMDVKPHQTPVLQAAMDAHFRVLEHAALQDKSFKAIATPHVLRAMANYDIYHEPLASTLGRMAAMLAGHSFHRLVQFFTFFTDFVSHLDASTAYRSARSFTDTCRLSFTDESSRIKLLYSVVNKLTLDEYEITQSNRGENGALEWVASLLSATVAVVGAFDSSDFAGLAVTILDQKMGTINDNVDAQIVETWGLLVPYLTGTKFQEVLELLNHTDSFAKPQLSAAVKQSRITIAHKCSDVTIYLNHLLELLVLYDDPANTSVVRNLFAPLAILLSRNAHLETSETLNCFRDVWLNLAALGITISSLKNEDLQNFKIVAKYTPALVDSVSVNLVESNLQLNPILRRELASNVVKIQQHALARVLSYRTPHFSSARTVFMAAVLLLEELRTLTGTVSKFPHYFADTEIGNGQGNGPMTQFTRHLTDEYVANLGFCSEAGLISISENLKELLVLACHRVEPVRHSATEMISKIVTDIPAALCQHDALYALLDCLTLLDDSVKNATEDEFSPKSTFKAPLSGVVIELSDSLEVRSKSLWEFENLAQQWIAKISTIMLSDLRSKLYTYLGHFNSDGRGCMFALDILAKSDKSGDFFTQYLLLTHYDSQKSTSDVELAISKLKLAKSVNELKEAYTFAAPHIQNNDPYAIILARESVKAPFRIFTEGTIAAGITFWHHTIRHQVAMRPVIVHEVIEQSVLTVHDYRGLFNRKLDNEQPLWAEMEYAPTSKVNMDRHQTLVTQNLAPHMQLLNGFLRSCMHNSVLLNQSYMLWFNRLAVMWLRGLIDHGSLHSIARNLRLEVIEFSLELLRFLWSFHKSTSMNRKLGRQLELLIVKAGLSWYNQSTPQWPYGSNVKSQARTLQLLKQFMGYLKLSVSASPENTLLKELVSQEYNKLAAWHDPLGLIPPLPSEGLSVDQLRTAWQENPHLAVRIGTSWNLQHPQVYSYLEELVSTHLLAVYNCPEALKVYLNSCDSLDEVNQAVIFWYQVSPVESINLLSPQYAGNRIIIQYALRSLQLHPVHKCFFYVPQIVQQLRHDPSGMVAEYILETAKFSQKFAHQIIWNIMANMYMDDDGTIPDPMKPQLDEVLNSLKSQFSEDEKNYYETEFKFFSEVTGISGKLKPYIKKSKAEKKEKIDEEMAKIKVPEGVYLPSHPDGTVIDIDRTGGKPLQSHAKAPFLANFKIRLDVDEVNEENVMEVHHTTKDVWQGAIFKVGDDCRQDVLALQVISVFRSIFNFCGLDVYVFPYKVTATAAGRGVIDVLPNSISRDMLGREAVNGLDQWYQSKHGGPNSIDFQRARLNFVKSMAAYSVISYLIQFKDRHNGNIMYDDDGHLIHIDFGFCFDIVPGGVRFEAAPFKLTKEMVRVMGGSQNSQPFRWFEKLCVQAFLASRVYADDICRVVEPMLESGLPCFKGSTIKKLRERFVLNKTEAEAAHHMRTLISKSYESTFTKGYDEFQRLTNGIPY